MSFRRIDKCRICASHNLTEVLDLGVQALTGVFPESPNEPVTCGPLVLVKCDAASGCGLLQLQHSYDLDEMYGDNYGYRSGLNPTMVEHLRAKVERVSRWVDLEAGNLVIDIGSNDGTTLGCYQQPGLQLLGIDPTGRKFAEHYASHIDLIPDFFSAARVREHTSKRAEVITSFSMFYDLEAPFSFMQEVAEVLSDTGIWIFEQSYMPEMLAQIAYDTVCHEHLEFYALRQIKWMTDRAGLKIVDVEFNGVNGGSFSVTCCHAKNPRLEEYRRLDALLAEESDRGLDKLDPYWRFAQQVSASRDQLLQKLSTLRDEGAFVAALGASTKGNVILQYCGINPDTVRHVGEVNPDKFGRFTPGSLIPIIDEQELLRLNPDYLLILPWHFKDFFENQPRLRSISKIYPLAP